MKIESLVRLALLNSEEVTNVVAKTDEGLPLIEVNRNPVGKYPLIELHIESGNDQQFADDKVINSYNIIQINFHCKNNEFVEVEEAINTVMYELGFVRTSFYSVDNQYSHVTQHTTSYRTTISNERLNDLYDLEKEEYRPPVAVLPDGKYFDPETGEYYEIINGERID